MRFESFVLVGALVAGCSDSPLVDVDVTITGSGYANINVHAVIAADGTMTRTRGLTLTRHVEEHDTVALAAETMADLNDRIDAVNFVYLDDRYDSTAVDDFRFQITARFESGSYTVIAGDSADVPDALSDLESTLLTIADKD